MNITVIPPVLNPPTVPIEAIAPQDAFLRSNTTLCIKDGNDLSFHEVLSGVTGHIPNGELVNPITVQITLAYAG